MPRAMISERKRAVVNVHLRNLIANVVASTYVLPVSLRVRLLRTAGVSIGQGTEVKSRCTFAGPGPVEIGSGGYVNTQCLFDATGQIVVEDNVYIGPRATIGTCTHDIGDAQRRAGRQYPAPVRIGSGTWIGMNATILPGVRIGRGCIIAAGAMVTEDCEADGMYGGVPARLLRTLDPSSDSGLQRAAV